MMSSKLSLLPVTQIGQHTSTLEILLLTACAVFLPVHSRQSAQMALAEGEVPFTPRDEGRAPVASGSSAGKLVRSSRAKTDCTCSQSMPSALMLLPLLSFTGLCLDPCSSLPLLLICQGCLGRLAGREREENQHSQQETGSLGGCPIWVTGSRRG